MTDDRRTDLRSRDDVEQLVRSFYRDAAMDGLLGPIFATAHVDWPSHIERLTDFSCWQLLGHRSYAGNPLRAHEPVQSGTPFRQKHFERWLDLLTAIIDESFRGPTADLAKSRETKMATALRWLLAGRHGEWHAMARWVERLGGRLALLACRLQKGTCFGIELAVGGPWLMPRSGF